MNVVDNVCVFLAATGRTTIWWRGGRNRFPGQDLIMWWCCRGLSTILKHLGSFIRGMTCGRDGLTDGGCSPSQQNEVGGRKKVKNGKGVVG